MKIKEGNKTSRISAKQKETTFKIDETLFWYRDPIISRERRETRSNDTKRSIQFTVSYSASRITDTRICIHYIVPWNAKHLEPAVGANGGLIKSWSIKRLSRVKPMCAFFGERQNN